jgi:hypothetical protein
MPDYEKNGITYSAERYAGELNEADIIALRTDVNQIQKVGHETLLVMTNTSTVAGKNNTPAYVKRGDWVLVDDDGNLSVESGYVFPSGYDIITPP